jgi:multicomponent Na+:H+ antiporter subunit G
MAIALTVLSWVCLMTGAAFAVIGGIGLLRLPDFYSRMHAGGITDTLGAALILLGLSLQAGLSLITVKLLLILIFSLMASPTSGYALAKSARTHGLEPLGAERADP